MRKELGLLLAACVLLPSGALAEWRVTTFADAMTDKKTTVAITDNSDQCTFGIFGREDGSVWMSFALPSSAVPVDTLTDDVNRIGLYRIDKLKAHYDLAAFWAVSKSSAGPASLGLSSLAITFSCFI